MNNAQRPGIIHVLLVEDNDGDVLLIRQALKTPSIRLELHVASTGESALEFVRGNNPRPHVIILDLNLPEKTGGEVLQELKSDGELRKIPVVVLTSSGALSDVQSAYGWQAAGYIRKPEDVDEYFAAVAALERYWTQTVLLPAA